MSESMFADQNNRLAMKMLEQQGELNKANERVAELEGERDSILGIAADCDIGADSALGAFNTLLSAFEQATFDRAELGRKNRELQAQLDRATASKLRIQRDSDRESKCERDESEHRCDACARCYQRVSEQLDRATEHTANLEEANTALQSHRDELKLLRDYLRQEYGRPAYAEIEDENDGPATFAIDVMNSEQRDNLDPKPAEPRPVDDTAFRELAMNQMAELSEAVASGEAFDLWYLINTIVDARPSREPRSMSEAPRVWVGERTQGGAKLWLFESLSDGNHWTGPFEYPLESGDIFVPGHLSKPTSDPTDLTMIATCSEVDWLPTTTAAGASEDES